MTGGQSERWSFTELSVTCVITWWRPCEPHDLIPICQNQSRKFKTIVLKWLIAKGRNPKYSRFVNSENLLYLPRWHQASSVHIMFCRLSVPLRIYTLTIRVLRKSTCERDTTRGKARLSGAQCKKSKLVTNNRNYKLQKKNHITEFPFILFNNVKFVEGRKSIFSFKISLLLCICICYLLQPHHVTPLRLSPCIKLTHYLGLLYNGAYDTQLHLI